MSNKAPQNPQQTEMNNAVADAELRQSVLAPQESWMLQAPAGSGKTELLMQRFLACLAQVEQPEAVLAITFTRKAAAEMRDRILAALERVRQPLTGELKEHERQTLEQARAALANGERKGWHLLEHPSRLQVRTLDSFCEAVAQRAPFKGQLGGAAEVSEDARPLYEAAAQQTLEELGGNNLPRRLAVERLLKHVDNSALTARTLLATMLERREQWLEFLGRSDAFNTAQQTELRARLEGSLARAVGEELAQVDAAARRRLNPEQREELMTLVRYAASMRGTAVEPEAVVVGDLAAGVVEMPRRTGTAGGAWPAPDAAELKVWRSIAALLLTSDGKGWRKRVDKRQGFPVDDGEQRAWKQRYMEVLAAVSTNEDGTGERSDALCSALGRVRSLPEAQYTEDQWEFMLAALQLLPLAAAHLKLVFAREGRMDFAEYAQRALDAIGADGEPTELALQLGYRIRHVLVDEFQDTNETQIELLKRLLKTWEADEACSTFYVGDPMQSIYAFRRADVSIFQRLKNEKQLGERTHRFEQLRQNFRSQSRLVEWFNQTFPHILDNESSLTNAVAYPDEGAVASREAAEGEAVTIRGFANGEQQSEAQWLAERVCDEVARLEAEENKARAEGKVVKERSALVAVLVRARSHLPQLAEALREAGVRFRAVKTDRLIRRWLVRDLESLRRALCDPADRTAWLSVLRAPWCGLQLGDLWLLCRGVGDSARQQREKNVRELLSERENELSAAGRERLRRVLPVLDAALAEFGKVALREVVERCWLRLGGAACVALDASNSEEAERLRRQAARDAQSYFALLDAEGLAGGVADEESFALKLDELYSPADTDPAIRVEVMPIHQAKGLEWDVVFLPALERRPRQDAKSLLYWRQRRGGTDELLLGPMEAAGTAKKDEASLEKYLRRLANDGSQEELKRLFYVAATRARQRLYLSAVMPKNNPSAGSMLRLLWDVPGMSAAFAPPEDATANSATEIVAAVIAAESSVKRAPMLLRRLPQEYLAPALPAPLEWTHPPRDAAALTHTFAWASDLRRQVGVVAHAYLQRMANDGMENWDAARVLGLRAEIVRALDAEGALGEELERGADEVVEALRYAITSERGRWILTSHEEHRCELDLSAEVDGSIERIRLDRTFVEDGTRWVVDYKITGREGGDQESFLRLQEEKYRPDMQRYQRVLRQWDERPLRCALFFPLLGAFREVLLGGD
jgi:ATP-dependent exoDNAse (exonuclease V) beta subunit